MPCYRIELENMKKEGLQDKEIAQYLFNMTGIRVSYKTVNGWMNQLKQPNVRFMWALEQSLMKRIFDSENPYLGIKQLRNELKR